MITVAASVLTAVVTAIVVTVRNRRKVEYMMDAMEDGELNFRFHENSKMNRALNRIRSIFERQRQSHETESWTKLIRVLTHEIMNTVTPIASLSEALAKDDSLDVKEGLETIAASSRGLIRFVSSYRVLAKVSRPLRKGIMVGDLVRNVLKLTEKQTMDNGVSCYFEEQTDDILLYADEGQISQILINLIVNAIQAGASEIRITAHIDKSDQVIIEVANNGRPISQESRDKIFVPFFTTKPEGSGIGLSLSREIMRQHGGTIDLLSSTPRSTVFALVFK